jgi:hypothetical protein
MNLCFTLWQRGKIMSNTKFLELWKDIRKIFDETIEKYDSSWRTRCRAIGTRFLIIFIMRLVIPKDGRGYGCTLMELFNQFLNAGLEDSPQAFASSSVCEARMKLDPNIFKELNSKIIEKWVEYVESQPLWHGHRLFGVDGSKFNLPRELIVAGYKTPCDQAHYPQGLVSGVYDLLTGIPHDFDITSHHNERTCAKKHLHEFFKKGDVIVYDRGYFSFEFLELHVRLGIHCIFRLQPNTLKEIEDFWDSDKEDEVLLLHPSLEFAKAVRKGTIGASLNPIKARLIKYVIGGTTFVLCTTLIDAERYPKDIFPGVYHSRWGFEEMLKVSKVITGVQDFHAKTELGIKQELFAHYLLITLQKIIELQSHHEVMHEKKLKELPKRRLKRLTSEKVLPEKEEADALAKHTENIKINTKNCFLNFGWMLERLLYFDPVVFLEQSIDYLVQATKKIYQKVRPCRSFPRASRKPIGKWFRMPKSPAKVPA